MEAKDEGAEVFDVPREHRHAWETWSNMCVFADRLRAKYGSTVVRKMADPMWDIRMLDNKHQSNAPQSLLTRQLNIAHGAQQLSSFVATLYAKQTWASTGWKQLVTEQASQQT